MDSSSSLSHQLSAKLISVFGIVLCTLVMLVYLLYARETEWDVLVNEGLPKVQQQAELNELAWKINTSFEQITTNKNAGELAALHLELINQLDHLKATSFYSKRQIAMLASRLKTQSTQLSNLANEIERNNLLLRSALIQLQLVSDEMRFSLDEKQTKLEKLYQQIMSDRVSDKVTVSRAKAHLALNDEVQLLEGSIRTLIDTQVLFERLSVQSSLVDFNYIAEQLMTMFDRWQSQLEGLEQANETDKKFLIMLNELQALLFGEQNMIAKWRGFIRVSQDYVEQVNQERALLNDVFAKPQKTTLLTQDFPGAFRELNKLEIDYSVNRYLLALFVFIVLSLLILFAYLRRVKSNIAQQEARLGQLTHAFVNGEEFAEEKLRSKELRDVFNALKTLNRPEHGEKDYQEVRQELNAQAYQLAEQVKTACFRYPVQYEEQNHFAIKLLHGADKKTTSNWRSLFQLDSVPQIIQSMRQAKQGNGAVSCEVYSAAGEPFRLTLSYTEHEISGTISSQQAILDAEITHEQALEQSGAALESTKQLIKNRLEDLRKALLRSLLQSQNPMKSHEDHYHQMYRHHNRLFTWSKQAKFLASEKQELCAELVDASLPMVLSAVTHNMMVEQKHKRNRILFNIAPEVSTNTKLVQPFFEQCISACCQLILSEQVAASLLIDVTIKDKNPGQQTLKIIFNLQPKTMPSSVPKHLEQLAHSEEESSDGPIYVSYLKKLLGYLHGQEVDVVMAERAIKVSAEFPVALSGELDAGVAHHTTFNQQRFHILANRGALSQQIANAIAGANGTSETFNAIEHVAKSLTTNKLKKSPVDCLIVTPELYKKEKNGVDQLLAGISLALRPKLFVIQSAFSAAIDKQGLYSSNDVGFSSTIFLHQLSGALTNDAPSNLLLPAEAFQRYQFRQTHVQVLLTSQNASDYAGLVTLLHWLGLNVHIENNVPSALTKWRTGQYLILLSSLQLDPFEPLDVGKKLTRGIFSLTRDSIDVSNAEGFSHWQLANVPALDDVEALINLFSPWLMPLPSFDLIEAKTSKRAASKPERKEETKPNISAVELDPVDKAADVIAAFDIQGYANNQGSPELAVFMLDEYIADIGVALQEINAALNVQNYQEVGSAIDVLILTSRILAAPQLLLQVTNLRSAIETKDEKQIQSSLDNVLSQYEILTEYCQAI